MILGLSQQHGSPVGIVDHELERHAILDVVDSQPSGGSKPGWRRS